MKVRELPSSKKGWEKKKLRGMFVYTVWGSFLINGNRTWYLLTLQVPTNLHKFFELFNEYSRF